MQNNETQPALQPRQTNPYILTGFLGLLSSTNIPKLMPMLGLRDRTFARFVLPVLLASAGYCLSLQPAEAKLNSLTNLVVIGDSYSDAGNSGLLTNAISPPGYPYPYYADGRYSNGPVTLEQVWTQINPLLPPLKPSQSPGGTNYAVGGATSGINNFRHR
jgi:hypothetical protein